MTDVQKELSKTELAIQLDSMLKEHEESSGPIAIEIDHLLTDVRNKLLEAQIVECGSQDNYWDQHDTALMNAHTHNAGDIDVENCSPDEFFILVESLNRRYTALVPRILVNTTART